jgi:hypothetical protein
MLAVVISVEAAGIHNAILLEHLSSEVALEEPEIRRSDPMIPKDCNCMDDDQHFGMPGGSRDYDDKGDESNQRDVILTTNWQQRAATDLQRFVRGTSDVDGYQGEDVDGADAVAENEALQADDGSAQNVQN